MLLDSFNLLWGLIYLGLTILSIYALVHAALQRDDAFRAADKRTKQFWLIILGVAVAVQLVLPVFLLKLVAIIATIVYLVDVRPAIQAISGGGGGRGGRSSSDGPYGPYNGGR